MDGMRWYVTDTAVRDYMRICGEDETDPHAFWLASTRLRVLCRGARFLRAYAGGTYESWRVRAAIRGKSRRLNLSVSLSQRAEGYADQLVAVQDNDAR